MPRLSILMAVYNRLDLTRRCLTTLEGSLTGVIDYEVIIVDDLSTDGTRDFLQTLSPPYRVVLNEAIELAKNYGGTDGHKFVNGVLDKLAVTLRPAEAGVG